MIAKCIHTHFDPEHWNGCRLDALIAVGSVIEASNDDALTLAEARRAISDFHECHVLALLSQLALEFGANDVTLSAIREYVLNVQVEQVFQ